MKYGTIWHRLIAYYAHGDLNNKIASAPDFNFSNLPVDVNVDADEKDEGDHTMNHQVEIYEIDLDVERVRPQVSGLDQCVVVAVGGGGCGCGGVSNNNNSLQLKELRGVVCDGENNNGQNIE